MPEEFDESEEVIDISPEIGVLGTFRHLNYTIWGALAELVDNSIESFNTNKDRLGTDHVIVNIRFNKYEKTITILDNAAGIKGSDIPRAFRTAVRAPDGAQLSEFGMGMKTSCSWFANIWQVTTKAFDEDIERTIKFNIPRIIEEGRLNLDVSRKFDCPLDSHYTIVEIKNPFRFPKGATLTKIKRHLGSIFREFLRNKTLVLKINDENVFYDDPSILFAPNTRTNSEEKIKWKQEFDFDILGSSYNDKTQTSEEVTVNFRGFVGLLETMRVADCGFAMIRRGRVIEGSADQDTGYRPQEIFGSPGSPLYKRLFGEIHVTGLDVGHQKDKFVWAVIEEADFLQRLREMLREPGNLHILQQGAEYRKTEPSATPQEVAENEGLGILEDYANNVETNLSDMLSQDTSAESPSYDEIEDDLLITKKVVIRHLGNSWTVDMEMTHDEAHSNNLLEILDKEDDYHIGIRLSLSHPFVVRHLPGGKTALRPIWSMVAALAIAEISTKRLSQSPVEVRKNMNNILKSEVREEDA